VRVPKGAIVGSGESGWLANDDWTNGNWQQADCDVRQEGATWTYTFRPLTEREFPEEVGFPAVFRRTLKLRLSFPSQGYKIQRVTAQTDSAWAEAEVVIEWRALTGQPTQRDGFLEAFNGEILQVKPINDQTRILESNRWRSRLDGPLTSGILAKVRYLLNEDSNSYDRTIITLRSDGFGDGLPGVSFSMRDALQNTPIYMRELGILIRQAGEGTGLNSFEANWETNHVPTLYDQVHALPEQTWEGSWANMLRKKSRMYFTIGCEGSRQKFGVEPTGDIFLTENGLLWAPGKDTPRLGWNSEKDGRELRFRLGFPAVEPGYRTILEEFLPVIRTVWVDGGVAYEQEAYATWLWGTLASGRMEGDDPVVAMLKVCFTNLSNKPRTISLPIETLIEWTPKEKLVLQDKWVLSDSGRLRLLFETQGEGSLSEAEPGILYQANLLPNSAHTIYIKIPHIDLTEPTERAQLETILYTAEIERVVAFWQERIAPGARIVTPNETVNNFYRTHLMHMLDQRSRAWR
jgi:hypothetical protein